MYPVNQTKAWWKVETSNADKEFISVKEDWSSRKSDKHERIIGNTVYKACVFQGKSSIYLQLLKCSNSIFSS